MNKLAAALGGAVTAISLTAGMFLPASPALAATGPFGWAGYQWCPGLFGFAGCNTTQSPDNMDNLFDPAQVSRHGSHIRLTMNADATVSGAINSWGSESWQPPVTISEQAYLPCDAEGKIENWPSFWLTDHPWTAEIDVMEGLGGADWWHYHYQGADGKMTAVGGRLPDSCGWHTYAVRWTSKKITIFFDGKRKGQAASSCASPCKPTGIPLYKGPVYVISNYAASMRYGGPVTGGVSMKIARFSAVSG